MTGRATTHTIDSSLIRRVTYGTDATLTVHLHQGAVYRYFTVPRTVFEALVAAASKGAYFNRYIATASRTNACRDRRSHSAAVRFRALK